VLEALVGVERAPTGDDRMVAHVLPVGPNVDPFALRAYLRTRLPTHLVPATLAVVDGLPYSPNGKLDRKAWRRTLATTPVPRNESAAPTDVVEARLQRIWERVLGVSGIGVRQSCFEVGGHSILGVRLLDEIERELAVPLPLAGLFEEATIERLAAIIRSIRGREPDTTIEAMAARYVAEIRRFQPDGPYRLLGWSLGGIVVFEMARQLRDLGERVDLAAVVDADAVSYEPPPSPDDLLLRMLLRADTEFAIDEAELAELDDDERLDRIVELARQAEVLPPLMPMARVLR
jgi:hypothetical protein